MFTFMRTCYSSSGQPLQPARTCPGFKTIIKLFEMLTRGSVTRNFALFLCRFYIISQGLQWWNIFKHIIISFILRWLVSHAQVRFYHSKENVSNKKSIRSQYYLTWQSIKVKLDSIIITNKIVSWFEGFSVKCSRSYFICFFSWFIKKH